MKIIITKPYDELKVGDILEASAEGLHWWDGGICYQDSLVTLLLEAGYAKEYKENELKFKSGEHYFEVYMLNEGAQIGDSIWREDGVDQKRVKNKVAFKDLDQAQELANRINKVIEEYDKELQGDCGQGTFPNKMRCRVVGCANEVVQDTNIFSDLCREHTRGH